MTDDEPLAHVAEDGRRQTLTDHLRGTAERAGEWAMLERPSPVQASGEEELATVLWITNDQGGTQCSTF